MFRRFSFSRIWTLAQVHALLVLLLNLAGLFISTWPRWSGGNDLHHSCTSFEGASRGGQPLNVFTWFIGAGGQRARGHMVSKKHELPPLMWQLMTHSYVATHDSFICGNSCWCKELICARNWLMLVQGMNSCFFDTMCAAVCCSVLQCWFLHITCCMSVLPCVAACCSVLQRVAACCSVSQRVAACCSVLQRVAAYCIWLILSCEFYSVRHVTRMNESCHTYEWVMSHIQISHVTHINESCHAHALVESNIWTSHGTCRSESCHTHYI